MMNGSTTNKGKRAAEESGKGKLLRRLGVVVLAAFAVIAVTVLTSMDNGRYLAALRRWLVYGDSRETRDAYSYAADPANRYGLLDESLLVVGSNAVRILQSDGTVASEISPLGMESPQLSVGSRLASVCDAGGDTLYILDQAGLRQTLTTERGLCYYAARLNGSDYLAVTEQKSGYKARVSVYDSSGTMIFNFDSYDNYISDAIVTEDCRSVVAVSLSSQGGVFASRLLVYDLERAELVDSCPIRDGLVYDLASRGDRVVSLCDTRLAITTLAGETLLDRSYGSLYLHDYALTGDDFCALLLGRYQAGNVCTLTTYGLDGSEIARLALTEEVLDMSAAGDYLAVLYGDSLVLYDRELQEHARLEGTGYAQQVQMEPNGTALVISGTSARRFMP